MLSGTLSECQMVWIQIRTNTLLVLIWPQTVCKGYQQTTKVAASKERVKQVRLSDDSSVKEMLDFPKVHLHTG